MLGPQGIEEGLNGLIAITAAYYDGSGSLINDESLVRTASINDLDWQAVSGMVAVPPGAASMRVQMYGFHTTGWLAFDDATVIENGLWARHCSSSRECRGAGEQVSICGRHSPFL